MNTRSNTLIVIATGVLAVIGAAHAQESGKVMIDVADCIKLGAPEARLACYESRVAAVFGERAAQAAAARPAESPLARPAEPASASVRSPEPAPVVSAPPASAPSPAPAPAAPVARAATRPPPQAAPTPAPSHVDRQTRREEKAQAEEAAAANDIVSRVAEMREVAPNTLLITLENGQVWRQTQSKQYPLRPGSQVRIYGTRWGSASRLSAEEVNSFIQVERVR